VKCKTFGHVVIAVGVSNMLLTLLVLPTLYALCQDGRTARIRGQEVELSSQKMAGFRQSACGRVCWQMEY
jgi:hypothetical protein